MDIVKIKKILKTYYPNSRALQEIIGFKYVDGILVLNYTDGQSIVYVLDNGKVTTYKKHTREDEDNGYDFQKLKSVFRDIKLTTIIDS